MLGGIIANIIPKADSFKPATIQDFFLSFKTALTALEHKVNDSKADVYIDLFEEIPFNLQSKYRSNILKNIDMAFAVVLLLENYINNHDRNAPAKQAKQQLTILKYQLAVPLKQLVDDNCSEISDGYTFKLRNILVNHFFFLANPLANFETTENPLHLALLNAFSDHFKKNYRTMFYHFNNHYLAVTKKHGSAIRKVTNLIEEIKFIRYNTKKSTPQDLASLRMNIAEAKEYVLHHCQYPDYIDVFCYKKNKAKKSRFSILSMYRATVIEAMFFYNTLLGAKRFNSENEIGYISYDAYLEESYQILEAAKKNKTSVESLPQTGQAFIKLHKKQTTESEVLTSKLSSLAAPSEEKEHKETTLTNHMPPELDLREREIFSYVTDESQLDIISDYLIEDKKLITAIVENQDATLKEIASPILVHCQSILKNSMNDAKAINELIQVLSTTHDAISINRTAADIKDLKTIANTIQGKPSGEWQLLAVALLTLAAFLLTPALISVLSPIAILHIPAIAATTAVVIAKKTAIAAAASLCVSGISFFMGHRSGLSQTVHEAAIKLSRSSPL